MTSLRRAELVTALSLATDLGSGVPMEMMLATCVVSLRLGEALGLSDEELRQTYYLSLLRHAGCTAESQRASELVGDELATTRAFFSMNPSQPMQMMGIMWHSIVKPDQPPLQRFGLLIRLVNELPTVAIAHCEVAEQLAARLGFDETIQSGLKQFPERWDGKGLPNQLKGEAILRSVRVAQVAQEAVVLNHFFGIESAVAAVRDRVGTTLDPVIAEKFCTSADQFLTMPLSVRDEVLDAEPGSRLTLTEEQFETALIALADFADLQTPFSTSHSTSVALLAETATRHCHLPEAQITLVRRAGYLHDIGRVGVSAGVWGKAGTLSEADWERVRLHPYYTQRILAQPTKLAELGTIASAHHERSDGSGYHRRLPAPMLSLSMTILAAAEPIKRCERPAPIVPHFPLSKQHRN
jgi:HD-GYP domain-containing protein (c-di-GMP phosphodiesterase class II)